MISEISAIKHVPKGGQSQFSRKVALRQKNCKCKLFLGQFSLNFNSGIYFITNDSNRNFLFPQVPLLDVK